MAIKVVPRAVPENLVQQWQFAIEINGFNVALFQRCDRPKAEFEEVAFAPAGSHRDQKAAGRVSFPNITADRGVSADGADTEVLRWMSEQLDFAAGVGRSPEGYVRDIALVEYDRGGNEISRWALHGAWVVEYDGGEFDGSASENVIESITFCYQFFTKD